MVVYTGVFGQYDELLPPRYKKEEFDYICFTDDSSLTSENWNIVQLTDDNFPKNSFPANSREKVIMVKLLSHKFLPDYDYSIWVDGNVQITGKIEHLVDKYLDDNYLAVQKHPVRNCIYEEAKACLKLGKGDGKKIKYQMDRYRELGYPEENGLIEANILFRKHNHPDVIELMEAWLEEIKNGSTRTQLSFNYVAWKQDFHYEVLEEGTFEHDNYFRLLPHLSKENGKWNKWKSRLKIRILSRKEEYFAYNLLYKIYKFLSISKKMLKSCFNNFSITDKMV